MWLMMQNFSPQFVSVFLICCDCRSKGAPKQRAQTTHAYRILSQTCLNIDSALVPFSVPPYPPIVLAHCLEPIFGPSAWLLLSVIPAQSLSPHYMPSLGQQLFFKACLTAEKSARIHLYQRRRDWWIHCYRSSFFSAMDSADLDAIKKDS